ncbi:phage protein [Desertibacillus haloalkaliphilus]|uniref:phage protein n=1 Tax=Desertibacillus haloalkaliphilus TaxID=1328930 RepID=UPI001C255095|nr:hypothetical protein [Desertibacillus haloalkaliphilus]MBU8908498.1 hypothetical protein [Desertibacillus haloalkaliphilus]
MRRVELYIGDIRFTFPEFTIYFRVEYDDSEDLNDAEIKIYNLSDETKNRIKKGMDVILNAGYEGDVGNIFFGRIEEAKTTKQRTDKITKILAIDASEEWLNNTINKTYKAGIRASQILQDIISVSGLSVGVVQLAKDITYQRGRTINGRIPNVVSQISKDCDSKVTITKGLIYIREGEQGDDIRFLFNAQRGLIGTPERFEDDDASGYEVTSLLNHRVQTDSLINVQSSTANGQYRVRKVVFTANRRDFYCDMEVVG